MSCTVISVTDALNLYQHLESVELFPKNLAGCLRLLLKMGVQMLEVSLSQQSQQRSEVEASELNHVPQKKVRVVLLD